MEMHNVIENQQRSSESLKFVDVVKGQFTLSLDPLAISNNFVHFDR